VHSLAHRYTECEQVWPGPHYDELLVEVVSPSTGQATDRLSGALPSGSHSGKRTLQVWTQATMAAKECTVLLALIGLANCALSSVDPSALISVVKVEDDFVVIKGLLDLGSGRESGTVAAVANLSSVQTETGWGILEVRSHRELADEDQAEAAGIAEGYLTR